MFVSDMAKADKIVLWDMSNLAFRSAHAFQGLTTKSGQLSGHVYGVLQMIASFVSNNFTAFDNICNVWCFDSYPKARRELFQKTWGYAYKGDRNHACSPVPDIQLMAGLIKGITAVTDGLECDSTMANIVSILQDPLSNRRKEDIYLVTTDKDLWALANRANIIFRKETITPERVWEDFQVEPEKVSMHKAIFGDKSDNIPPLIPRLQKRKVLPYIQKCDGTTRDLFTSIMTDKDLQDKFQDKLPLLESQMEIVRLFTDDIPAMKMHEGDEQGFQEFLKAFEIQKVDTGLFLGQ